MKGNVKGLSFSWAYLKVSQCYNKGGVCFYDKMVKGDIRRTLKKLHVPHWHIRDFNYLSLVLWY